MAQDIQADVQSISRIEAVPTILQVVCRTTGMGFAAVARVSEDRWIACSVVDQIEFALKPGDELKIETTICNEIRHTRQPVVIDNVAEDPLWRNHHTSKLYGFQSYISVPITLADGTFFGTLCAIDPNPANLKNTETLGMFRMFADLIARQLDASRKFFSAQTDLVEERRLLKVSEGSLQASERSNKALQRFASIAAHDLREPLRQVPLKTANVEDALDDALRGLSLALQEAEAVIARDPLPTIAGNQAQLAQLFQNLISNAVKYRSEAALRINVSAVLDKSEWVFSVSDNGLGVPPEHREKIFEVFARLHGPEIAGAGLGLAFCSKIVELHHGSIWMEPNPDLYGGSIFKFSLPAV